MEFAVIQTGGKQYKVSAGQTLKIEKMPGDFKKGDPIIFDKVLLVDDGKKTEIGAPFIGGAKVKGEFIAAGRNAKVLVIKYKSKVREFKKKGHRQPHFQVKITSLK